MVAEPVVVSIGSKQTEPPIPTLRKPWRPREPTPTLRLRAAQEVREEREQDFPLEEEQEGVM